MKKNLLYNIIYQILILIIPLITTPYISRILNAEGIGIYSYTYSIVYYFMIVAMLGLNNYGNRSIAKVRDDKEKLSKEFCSIYIFQIITSLLMIICYYIYTILFSGKYKTIAMIQGIYVISCLFDINWFYFGIEKFKLTITRNMIIKILSLVLIFIVVKKPDDVWKYTIILSASTLFSNIILFSFLNKYIKFVHITKEDIKRHLKPNLTLFLPVIAVSIYKIMDKIMLGIMSNIDEVGYYENAAKIVNVPLTIITALGTVMLPRVSNMISKKQENKVKEILNKTMPFIMFITLPMTFGLIAIGRDFSIIFLGSDFEKSGYLIQLLSITLIFLAWGNVIRTEYLIPKEKDKEYVISAFLGAIINVVMNIIFIPKYNSIGACFGTILAEFVVMMYQTWVIRNEIEIKKYIKASMCFFIKTIIMLFIIIIFGKLVKDNLLRVCLQVILGATIYFMLNIKYIANSINVKKL